MYRLIEKWVVRPFLWLRNGLKQFQVESRYLGDAMVDLMVNLHCLSGKRSANAEREAVLVVVHHVGFQWYLTFLREIGVIPEMRIVAIRTSLELVTFLDGLRSESQPVNLILGRNLYFRYHHLIAAEGAGCHARII